MKNKKYLFLINLIIIGILSGLVFYLININKVFNGNIINQKATNSNEVREVVNIPDVRLKTTILNNLKGNKSNLILSENYTKPEGENDIYKDEMEKITSANFDNLGIGSVEGLDKAINLKSLSLNRNLIRDVKPISKLINLKELYLNVNAIKDISSLETLTKLEVFNIIQNGVTNFDVVKSFKSLYSLSIVQNLVVLRPDNNKFSIPELKDLKGNKVEIQSTNSKLKKNEDGTYTFTEKPELLVELHGGKGIYGSNPKTFNWESSSYNLFTVVIDTRKIVIEEPKKEIDKEYVEEVRKENEDLINAEKKYEEEAEKEYNKELEKNKKEENKLKENKPEEKIEQKENIQPKKLPYAGTNGILSELILVALIVTGIYAINSKKRLNSIKRVTNIINGSIRRKNK